MLQPKKDFSKLRSNDISRNAYARRVVEIAERRIRNSDYAKIPKNVEDASKRENKQAYSCIGGVCTVLKEAGAMNNVDWSNTNFALNAKKNGFGANNGYGVKHIMNLEPGDVMQYQQNTNKQGKHIPSHSQIYLGKNKNGDYRFYDNQAGVEKTIPETDVKAWLDPTKNNSVQNANIYKVNSYANDNPFYLTPEEISNAKEKESMIKRDSTSKKEYDWKISDKSKNYNSDTKPVMDKFIEFANDNDKINNLVKQTGMSKDKIQDSLLNVFGELGQENNWTTSKGKGLGSRLENIAESVITSMGRGKNRSVGPGQIKYNSISPEDRLKYNIKSPNDLYDLEKVLPLMTASDLKDKAVIENWGKNDTLGEKLFGITSEKEWVKGKGDVPKDGGFTQEKLNNFIPGGNSIQNNPGRWSPYLRNQYSSIANNTITTGNNDFIPFNTKTVQNFTKNEDNNRAENTMLRKYTRDPGSYANKVEEGWQNNLERKWTGNESGEAIQLDEVKIEKQYAMGGNLNDDMKNRYADGGNLTRFNEGGTHEQNPLGGIPQGQSQDGQMNTVEQGETKMGSFIYSDRISLNPDMIKQFNLPGYASGKTVADASKAIEDKFKDRNDKYANETKTTLLKRLEQAQETHKAEQAQMQGAMDANAQQGPEDMMGGQIPEGMEEFAGEQPQMAPEEAEATPMAAYGGYQPKMYLEGGDLDPVTGLRVPMQAASSLKPAGMVTMPNALPTAPLVPASAGKAPISAPGAAPGAGPSAGAIVGGLSTAMELGQTAFGKAAQDISGTEASGRVGGAGMIGGSAIKGAAAGAAIGGPWGAAIGGVVGGAAGIVGLGKARAAEALNTQRFATNTNRKFSDNYAAYGGNLNIRKYADGGDIDPQIDPRRAVATRQDSINVRDHSRNLLKSYMDQGYTTNIPEGMVFPENNNQKAYNQMRDRSANRGRTQVIENGQRVNRIVDPKEYRQDTGLYTYLQGETANGVLNRDMGRNLFDTRIDPIGSVNLMGTRGASKNDGVSFPNYADMKISGEGSRMAQNVTSTPSVNPIPKKTYSTPIPVTPATVPVQARRNASQYMETSGPAVRDNTRVGTNFGGYDPSLVRKANTRFADGGNLMIDPPIKNPVSRVLSETGIAAPGSAPVVYGAGFNTKPIVRYQPGVTSGKDGSSGAYLYSRNTDAPGFNIESDREFVRNSNMEAVRRTPEWGVFSKSQAGKQFALGGPMDLEAESLAATTAELKLLQSANNLSRERGILKQGSQNAAAFTKYADANPLGKSIYGKAGDIAKKGLNIVNQNAAEAMRYAPIAANMLQRKNLKAPTGVQYATLENRYKPRYADEAQMQTAVGQASNNTMNAINQSGGSEGATRAAILGVGANATRGLSDAYLQANAQNASQDATAQQFNLGVDSSNVATKNRAIDEMRMDDAAYRGAKSKLLGQMGTDIGSIGKEQADAQLAGALTGYSRKGKYLYKPDGTRATPEEVAKITNIYNRNQGSTPTLKKGDKYIDEKGVTQTFKMGGYLTTKKYK